MSKREDLLKFITEEHLTRDNLISCCRYYKGEEKAPKGTNELFWDYENKWVEFMLDDKEAVYMNQIDKEYRDHGLSDFSKSDGVPQSLKNILFNRYSHWCGCDVNGFKDWYLNFYLMGC